ncbi:MAG TPA: hypothetical protein VFJ02_09110 [Vicinamibacterales bacterium]|nr:hypothetical protein [Vicinamibacterales bacterium]
MVIVPVRCVATVLAATLYETAPFAVPLLPPVIVIHDALLTAVHAHPVAALTVTLPVVAVSETARLVGEIAGAHATEYPKVLDAALAVAPPGPIAVTRAS